VESVVETSGYAGKAEIETRIPATVMVNADRDRLFSVIDSLLSNAINYSKPPRKITITYRSDDNDRFHHLAFEDNGIGISAASLPYIFEPFQLADAAKLSRKYDRIGLSLSIAKQVIVMHGGDITVTSIENSGSTFTIHLPKEEKSDV
jgi:signal transduction histidine kinase